MGGSCFGCLVKIRINSIWGVVFSKWGMVLVVLISGLNANQAEQQQYLGGRKVVNVAASIHSKEPTWVGLAGEGCF